MAFRLRSTIMQLATPDHMRGRVSSINGLFVGSSMRSAHSMQAHGACWDSSPQSSLAGSFRSASAVTAWRAPKLRRLHFNQMKQPIPDTKNRPEPGFPALVESGGLNPDLLLQVFPTLLLVDRAFGGQARFQPVKPISSPESTRSRIPRIHAAGVLSILRSACGSGRGCAVPAVLGLARRTLGRRRRRALLP